MTLIRTLSPLVHPGEPRQELTNHGTGLCPVENDHNCRVLRGNEVSALSFHGCNHVTGNSQARGGEVETRRQDAAIPGVMMAGRRRTRGVRRLQTMSAQLNWESTPLLPAHVPSSRSACSSTSYPMARAGGGASRARRLPTSLLSKLRLPLCRSESKTTFFLDNDFCRSAPRRISVHRSSARAGPLPLPAAAAAGVVAAWVELDEGPAAGCVEDVVRESGRAGRAGVVGTCMWWCVRKVGNGSCQLSTRTSRHRRGAGILVPRALCGSDINRSSRHNNNKMTSDQQQLFRYVHCLHIACGDAYIQHPRL